MDSVVLGGDRPLFFGPSAPLERERVGLVPDRGRTHAPIVILKKKMSREPSFSKESHHDLRLAGVEPEVVVEEGRVHGGVTGAGLADIQVFRVVVGRWPPSGT